MATFVKMLKVNLLSASNAEMENRTTTKNVTIRTLMKEMDALNVKLRKGTPAPNGLQFVTKAVLWQLLSLSLRHQML